MEGSCSASPPALCLRLCCAPDLGKRTIDIYAPNPLELGLSQCVGEKRESVLENFSVCMFYCGREKQFLIGFRLSALELIFYCDDIFHSHAKQQAKAKALFFQLAE